MKNVWLWIYARPYLLLALAMLFFGGNTVAGRLAAGHISPYQLVTLRWVMVVMLMAALLRGKIFDAWPHIKGRAVKIFVLGVAGFTSFNTLFYVAAHKTSAVNLGILQGTIPMWVLAGALVFWRLRAGTMQIVGALITVAGVAVLAAKGELAALAALAELNGGDLMMLLACFCYACYTLGLRDRPPVHGLELFFFLAVAALLSSLPLAAHEIWSGEARAISGRGWLVLLYVAVFPSCLSQIFYIRGVELLGPSRAGVFVNLVPVFSAACAVLLIDEPLHWFQLAALALVIGGIALSEKAGRGNAAGG